MPIAVATRSPWFRRLTIRRERFAGAISGKAPRDRVLSAAEWPARAVTTLVAEAYDGDHAFHLWDAVNGTARIRSAEHLLVRGGVIAASEIVGDLADFQVFMAAG